jgi:hypothetical protein
MESTASAISFVSVLVVPWRDKGSNQPLPFASLSPCTAAAGWIDFDRRSEIERDPGAPLAALVFHDQLMLLDPFDLGN